MAQSTQIRPAQAAGSAVRARWIDTVKGTAIVLVVLGHSIGLQTIYGFEAHGAWNDLNILLGLWRMPVFMLVAGFFVTRSLHKYGTQYWRRRPLNMVWLFLIWTVIYFAAYALIGAASVGLTPMGGMGAWGRETVMFDSYLWFLLALAIYYSLQAVVGRRPNLVVLLLALVLYMIFVPGLIETVTWGSNEVPKHWLFFLVGAWYSEAIRARVPRIRPWQGVLFVLAFLASVVVWMPTRDVPVVENIVGAVPPLLGIPAGLWILHALDGRPGMRWARRTGANSLPIYVLHAIWLQLLLAVLARVGLPGAGHTVMLYLGPLLTTAVTVALCLLTHRLTRTVPYLWAFPPPREDPRPAGRRAAV